MQSYIYKQIKIFIYIKIRSLIIINYINKVDFKISIFHFFSLILYFFICCPWNAIFFFFYYIRKLNNVNKYIWDESVGIESRNRQTSVSFIFIFFSDLAAKAICYWRERELSGEEEDREWATFGGEAFFFWGGGVIRSHFVLSNFSRPQVADFDLLALGESVWWGGWCFWDCWVRVCNQVVS